MTFFDDYKKIRNKIRTYDPLHLIDSLIIILHNLNKDFVTYTKKGYMPWDILALIKWILANYEKANISKFNRNIRIANAAEINGLIRSTRDLFEKYRVDGLNKQGKDKITKFFRKLAFQQFWLQPISRLTGENMSRQSYLFCSKKNPKTEEINKLFQGKTNLSIFSFFEISFMIWTKFNLPDNNTTFITKAWFVNVGGSFTENEVETYFNLLSLPLDKAKNYAIEDLKKKQDKLEYQQLEQSPFTFFPFLKDGDNYIIYSPALLDYTIRYFVYDYLKLEYNSDFLGGELFGKVFQDYIKTVLDYTNIKYIPEDDLNKHPDLKSTKSKVDFLVEQEGKAVLIEAKATEMQSFVKATQDNEILIKYLEKSIIKGVKQAYRVANDLKSSSKVYLLIVTYKELYLGRAGSIWNEFLEDALEDFFTKENIDPKIIKPDNIFVISIDDFDMLAKAIKIDEGNLLKVLDKAASDDSDPSTGRFTLGEHIKDFLPKKPEHLPFLKESGNDIFSSIKEKLKKK